MWQCEFCGHANSVDLVPEELKEISSGPIVDFLVSQPDKVVDEAQIMCTQDMEEGGT